jgi:putative transposase
VHHGFGSAASQAQPQPGKSDTQEEAIENHGAPEIFNSDQGSQFISTLKPHGIQISMDSKGRWVDNVFVERLWRSVKYEEV